MDHTDVFVNTVLKHAGTRIYDPVKTHEYYERTKNLKGKNRRPALKGKKKKEGWAYVQSVVKDRTKKELASAASNNKAAVEQLRATGAQRRTALSEKIKALVAQGTADPVGARAEKEQLAASIKTSIEKARDNYKKAREGIKNKYEAILQREYDALKAGPR